MKCIIHTLFILFICNTAILAQVIECPVFNFERGFYDSPILVNLQSSDSSATIRYTLDGSIPSPGYGNVYGFPIVITGTSYIRAIAYSPTDTSEVVTHSYIYLNEVMNSASDIQQYESLQDLPSISIVTDSLITTGEPVSTSIEFIYPNSNLSHQANAGIRHTNGGAGNTFDKKTMRLYFKSRYGKEKLNFDLFEAVTEDIIPTNEFDKINLRYGSQDNIVGWWQAPPTIFLRNRWGYDTQLDMGWHSPHGTYMHVYINGAYNGMYHVHELPDESFQESYRTGEKEEYDIIKNGFVVEGDNTAWSAAYNLLSNGDYQGFAEYVDLENFIDYHLLSWYQGNADWPQNNWMMARRRAAGEKFQFFCWDLDRTMQDINTNAVYSSVADFNISTLISNDPDFAMLVEDRIYKHFFCDETLSPQKNIERFIRRVQEIKKGVIAETNRWDTVSQDPTNQGSWLNNIDWYLNTYFPNRTNIVIQQLIDAGYYDGIDPVVFSQNGGTVFPGFQLTLINPNGQGTIYYTTNGTDPRLPGGGLSPDAQQYTGAFILPNPVVTIWARVLTGSTWSPACPTTFYFPQDYESLVINEINYHPKDSFGLDGDDFEFIEIKNTGTNTINLANTRLSDGVSIIMNEILIEADSFIVLARDTVAFLQKYGFQADGQYKGKLNNSGDKIMFSDPSGNLIDSIIYNDQIPWDTLADGHGFSLEFINTELDNTLPASWRRSSAPCGSPRRENTIFCGGLNYSLVINEINYTYNQDFEALNADDWVEIYNNGAVPVDVSDWIIQDTEQIYTIPEGTTIGVSEYLVIARNLGPFNRTHPNVNAIGSSMLGFSSQGDMIALLTPNGCPIDGLFYDIETPWDTTGYTSLALYSAALDNTEAASWANASNHAGTPGAENSFPCNNTPASGIIINEINYKSPIDPEAGDWVELHNSTASPIDISEWEFHDNENFYTIPAGTIIPGFGYHVLVSEVNKFNNIFPDVDNYSGPIGFNISGSGDILGLFNKARCLQDFIKYEDNTPWSDEPDGNGPTLALIDSNRDNELPGSWVPSTQGGAPNGTPGADNNITDPCIDNPPQVIINEISYFPLFTNQTDWLELYNRTGFNADISNWKLYFGNSAYTIPQGTTIPPNSYLVLTQSGSAFSTQFPGITNYIAVPNLALGNQGDKMMLYSDLSCLIDEVEYTDSYPWPVSNSGSYTIALISPYQDNNDPGNWINAQSSGTPGNPNTIMCGTLEDNEGNTSWLKASSGTTSAGSSPGDGTLVDGWLDQSGQNTNASQELPSKMPEFYENVINGNPVLRWDGTDDWYRINDLAEILSTDASFYVVVEPHPTPDNAYYLSTNFGGLNRIKFGHNPAGQLIYDDDVPPLSTDNYHNKKTIIGFSITTDTRVESHINGKTATPWTLNMNSSGADRASIGQEFDGAGSDNETSNHWKGDLAEILVFDYQLPEEEQKIIETYLAIKYGITIEVDRHLYYDHQHYNNNIAGIGTDLTQCLEQTYSMSVHEGAIVSMQAGTSLNQGDYMVWGHDSTSVAPTTTETPSTTLQRLTRTWRISETGDAGEVEVSFDLTGTGIDMTNVENFAILIDRDDGNFSNAITHYTDRVINGNTVSFVGVNFQDDDWFTLAVLQQNCPVNDFNIPAEICYLTPGNFAPNVEVPGATYEWSFELGFPGTVNNATAETVWNQQGNSEVTLTITYPHCSSEYTQNLFVDICNTKPIAQDDSYSSAEDFILVSNILSNDSDPENQNIFLDITSVSQPQYGNLNINSDGIFVYTPSLNFVGTDSFSYSICDDGVPVFCDEATVSIIVSNINDAPIATNDTLLVIQDGFLTGNLLDNDTDPEGDALIIGTNPTMYPQFGDAVLQNDGMYYYLPDDGFVGIDSFSYLVCDTVIPAACSEGTVLIVVEEACLDIQLQVWLEGAYDTLTQEMRTTLNTEHNMLPGQIESGAATPVTPAGQPYNQAPWNYNGSEGMTYSTYAPEVVDWVLVSFRTAPERSSEVFRTAALLLNDGTIQFEEDCTLDASGATSYYVLIEHRNHIGAMSPTTIDVTNRILNYDFRASDSYKDATSFGQVEIASGIWTMFAGDGNQSADQVSYDVNGSDVIIWVNTNGEFGSYLPGDYNMDGDINGEDKIILNRNNGISSRVPK